MTFFGKIVLGLVEIGSGLARVVTLGWWSPKWILSYCTWDARRRHRLQGMDTALQVVRSEADES